MATIAGNLNQQDQDQSNQTQLGQQNQGQNISTGGGAVPSTSSTQSFNQSQQAPRQIGSGRFTNIQSYLGANRQAGQQLGQNLQKGIGQQLNQAQSTAGRTLGEATQQQQQTQQAYGQGWQQYQALGGQQQTPYTQNQQPTTQYKDASGNVLPTVNQPQQYSFAAPTGDDAAKGTLASEYIADIGSRQQAALDLASNADALKAFSGLRSGETQTQQQKLIEQKTQTARDTAEALKRQQEQRSQQLATESGRSGLLSEFIGGKNYGVGQRSLDAAFLQRDPNRAVDTLRQNISGRAADVRRALGDVGTAEQQTQQLQQQGSELSTQLGAQTKQNVQDYVSNLESRIDVMEKQRGQKMDWARNQLDQFKGGKALNQEFLDLMGLQQGKQLFNVPKDLKDVSEIMDVSNLDRQLNLQDVSNEKDVANYAALAQLAGLSPGEYQIAQASQDKDISQYGAGDERTLTARTDKAKQDFLNNAMNQIVSGTTSWVGGQQGRASQSALDFLTGGSNVSKEAISAGDDFRNSGLSGLLASGGRLGAQLSPYIGGAVGTYFGGPLGGMAGQVAGQAVAPSVIQAGDQLGRAVSTEGGDIEKGVHLGAEAMMLPTTLLPGTLGEAGQNVTGVIQDFISNISGLGDTRDSAADRAKDRGYALQRSQSYLDNELAGYLRNAGFYNYMGDKGLETQAQEIKGSWDGNTWYNPTQDLARFGYGSQNLSSAGQFDPTRTSVPDISLNPLEQAIPVQSGVSRDEILKQLALNGQLGNEV